MTEFLDSPQSDDAILSDSKSDRLDLILGGIEGVKQRLSSQIEAVRIEALSQASQYGREGLNLIIKAFREDSEAVRRSAYFCLCDRQTPEIKKIIQGYYPWDWKSCKNLFICPINADSSRRLVMSANGQFCAFNRSIMDRDNLEYIPEIWDLQNPQKLRDLPSFKTPPKLAMTNDGQILITGEYIGQTISAWNPQTGEKIFTQSVGAVGSVAIGEENETLVFSRNLPHRGSREYTWETQVEIWSLAKQKRLNTVFITVEEDPQKKYGKFGNVRGVAVHARSKMLLCNAFTMGQTGNPIEAWNIVEGKNEKSYTLNFPKYYRNQYPVINPNGLSFATAMTYTAPYSTNPADRWILEDPNEQTVRDRSITLWKLHKDPEIDLLENSSKINDSECKSLVRKKQFLGLIEAGEIDCCAFSPDGKILATSSRTILAGRVTLWNLDSYQKICIVTEENRPIEFVKFNQDGNVLYTATDKALKAWGF